jgi:predicted DNA-binding transcriptional regulator YafY
VSGPSTADKQIASCDDDNTEMGATILGKPKRTRFQGIASGRHRSDADRRVNQADRFARILRLLELIQGNGRWNARALAREFECTEQTIYRFLRVLEYAGVPFYFDRENQSYRVSEQRRFPVLNLTPDELVGQSVATAATKAPGLNVGTGAAATSRKLAETLSSESREILQDAERLIQVLGLQLADHSRHRDVIWTVQSALLQRRQVTGRYRSPYDSKAITIRLHPYRLCLVKNAWYVIGKADKYPEVRTFRVARFTSLRLLEASANVPEDFELQEYFGNAWAVYRGAQRFEVDLRFSSESASIVVETLWHHTQKMQKHADGSATLSFSVDGLEEILNWILGWTGHVTVLQPAELREMYGSRLRTGLRLNEEA